MTEFLLIDGPSFLWRAFHAIPPRARADGHPVNALEGIVSMLLRPLVERNHSSHVGVFFESEGPTFRHKLYAGYKAERPDPPTDLVRQLPLFRAAVRAFGFRDLDCEGFEADDLMATVTTKARAMGAAVTIVSPDKDLMQLIGPGVRMYDQRKKTILREVDVEAKFGVGPERVIDVQALAGDTTDGVPGVPGIGIKTAARLVRTFGDLESVLAETDKVGDRKIRKALELHAAEARLSRELATLRRDVPLGIGLEAFRVAAPPRGAYEFLAANGLAGLAPRAATRFPEWRPYTPRTVRKSAPEQRAQG